LTSPGPHDGTSLVAANLAASVAQLGRRVLLIDANLHRPRQHEIFGVAADTGLCSAYLQGKPLIDAATPTAVENLWLLPAGAVPAGNCELFASPQFAELLAAGRQRFDVLLIDSGAVLAVSDPCVIGSQVDGVLLTLRPTRDSRWRAQRAKEILESVGVTPLGVVVNDVGAKITQSYRSYPVKFESYNGTSGRNGVPATV
jgi:capsular exopolysaccharide synthesis family protein